MQPGQDLGFEGRLIVKSGSELRTGPGDLRADVVTGVADGLEHRAAKGPPVITQAADQNVQQPFAHQAALAPDQFQQPLPIRR